MKFSPSCAFGSRRVREADTRPYVTLDCNTAAEKAASPPTGTDEKARPPSAPPAITSASASPVAQSPRRPASLPLVATRFPLEECCELPREGHRFRILDWAVALVERCTHDEAAYERTLRGKIVALERYKQRDLSGHEYLIAVCNKEPGNNDAPLACLRIERGGPQQAPLTRCFQLLSVFLRGPRWSAYDTVARVAGPAPADELVGRVLLDSEDNRAISFLQLALACRFVQKRSTNHMPASGQCYRFVQTICLLLAGHSGGVYRGISGRAGTWLSVQVCPHIAAVDLEMLQAFRNEESMVELSIKKRHTEARGLGDDKEKATVAGTSGEQQGFNPQDAASILDYLKSIEARLTSIEEDLRASRRLEKSPGS